MTPSTAPLPSKDEDTPKVPTEGVSDVTDTAGSQVAANSLLLRSIMDHLDSKTDVVTCMLLSKEHFELAARVLYRSSQSENFSELWDQGCTTVGGHCLCLNTGNVPDRLVIRSQERLRVYADGVRTLKIDEYYPSAVTLERLLQQYDGINEIHLSVLDGELHLREAYNYKDRQVIIRGSQTIVEFGDVLLIAATVNDMLEYFASRSVGSEGQRLKEEEGKELLDRIINEIEEGKGGATWLASLTQLELPSVTFSLERLETVLVGCPRLKVLRCSLDARGMSNDQTGALHKDLRQLFKRRGVSIEELDVRYIGGGTIQWLQTLVGPPILRLSGMMDPIDPDLLQRVITRERNDHREHQSRQLILSIRDVPLEKVNPYEAAKVLRWALSPFCDIHVEVPEDGTPAATNPKVEGWVEQFRSILKTLQKEDDIKRKTSMSKGWKEMQKVPDGGDAGEASGSGPVENAPDGGDIKTASGSGDIDGATANSGVDSTVGGGDEPSLWYVSLPKTDVPKNHLAESESRLSRCETPGLRDSVPPLSKFRLVILTLEKEIYYTGQDVDTSKPHTTMHDYAPLHTIIHDTSFADRPTFPALLRFTHSLRLARSAISELDEIVTHRQNNLFEIPPTKAIAIRHPIERSRH